MFAVSPPAAPAGQGARRIELDQAGCFRDVRESLRTLARDGGLAVGQPVLVDLRGALFLLTSPEAAALADELSSTDTLGAHAVALVVAGGAPYGVARMVCTLAELRGGRVGAFTDDRAAVDWLMG